MSLFSVKVISVLLLMRQLTLEEAITLGGASIFCNKFYEIYSKLFLCVQLRPSWSNNVRLYQNEVTI